MSKLPINFDDLKDLKKCRGGFLHFRLSKKKDYFIGLPSNSFCKHLNLSSSQFAVGYYYEKDGYRGWDIVVLELSREARSDSGARMGIYDDSENSSVVIICDSNGDFKFPNKYESDNYIQYELFVYQKGEVRRAILDTYDGTSDSCIIKSKRFKEQELLEIDENNLVGLEEWLKENGFPIN